VYAAPMAIPSVMLCIVSPIMIIHPTELIFFFSEPWEESVSIFGILSSWLWSSTFDFEHFSSVLPLT
jgi:hypothetical protein